MIGIGKVGSTASFLIAMDGLAGELLLWNRTGSVARAEAVDIQQASAFIPRRVTVRAGEAEDTAGSDILVMCASVPKPRDMADRSQLASGNAALIRELLPRFTARSPEATIVNVTKPLDAMTGRIQEVSGLPWQRVIGTGTLVDSTRFRNLLSQRVGIHPLDLKACVVGEHGETQFAA